MFQRKVDCLAHTYAHELGQTSLGGRGFELLNFLGWLGLKASNLQNQKDWGLNGQKSMCQISNGQSFFDQIKGVE